MDDLGLSWNFLFHPIVGSSFATFNWDYSPTLCMPSLLKLNLHTFFLAFVWWQYLIRFQLTSTWPDFETFPLKLRSFWLRSPHSFKLLDLSLTWDQHLLNHLPEEHCVRQCARAASRLWRDFIIGSYRMGRSGRQLQLRSTQKIYPISPPIACPRQWAPWLSYRKGDWALKM